MFPFHWILMIMKTYLPRRSIPSCRHNTRILSNTMFVLIHFLRSLNLVATAAFITFFIQSPIPVYCILGLVHQSSFDWSWNRVFIRSIGCIIDTCRWNNYKNRMFIVIQLILYIVLWYMWFKNIYYYLYASCRSSRDDLHANVFEPEYSCSTMFVAILACHFEYEVYFVFWGSIMYLRRKVFPDQTPQ